MSDDPERSPEHDEAVPPPAGDDDADIEVEEEAAKLGDFA